MSDGGSSVSKPVRSSAGGNSGGTRISYKVRSGDSLGKIASRHGVTVAQLKSWNHLRSNTIKAGQRLYIYKKGSSGYSSTSSKSSSGSSSNYVTYTVRSGDTLSKIASRYGTTVSKIQKANGIGSKIRAGQKLKIPR